MFTTFWVRHCLDMTHETPSVEIFRERLIWSPPRGFLHLRRTQRVVFMNHK